MDRWLSKWLKLINHVCRDSCYRCGYFPMLAASRQPRQREGTMNRQELLLAILAAANGRAFHPAQLQKAMFLIDRNVPGVVDDGPSFHFVPYNYGPFDKSVYVEAERLRDQGDAVIAPAPGGRWRTYAATAAGINLGRQILARLNDDRQRYLSSIAEWVLARSFGDLVKSIYETYPEMRANSIFQD